MSSETLSVIGIDLGTTYSCVGCMKNGQVEIIATDSGQRTTPSIVSYMKQSQEILVGNPATFQLAQNYENTFYDSKRIIGKVFQDPSIDSDIEKFPFKIIKDPQTTNSGEAVFELTNGHIFPEDPDKYWVSPQEVAAEILKNLKASAQAYLGFPIDGAVITVPAYFNNEQRKATKQAGELAGLNVLRLLNEPTAAALAYGEYGSQKPSQSGFMLDLEPLQKTILVFDLGGGTFDVSLLTIKDQEYHVKGVDGDNNLGGEDFTNCMVDHLLEKFAEQVGSSVSSLSKSTRVVRRLREQCEKVKKILSFADFAYIEIEGLQGENDFFTQVTREEFENMCSDLFSRLTQPLDTVLSISNTPKTEVDEVVLIGGSTRIPQVRKVLKNYFNNPELKETINPDEAVAFGATMMAVQLSKEEGTTINEKDHASQFNGYSSNKAQNGIKLEEKTPMTISMKLHCDIVETFIPKNTPIPCKKTLLFSTSKNYQTMIPFTLMEGESPLVEKNNLLGSFNVNNLTPRLRGRTKVSVTATINLDGIMKVQAYELPDPFSRSSKSADVDSSQDLVIENVTNTLTTNERVHMIQRYDIDKEADRKEYERRKVKLRLYGAFDDAFVNVRNEKEPLSEVMRDIYKELIRLKMWFDQSPNASIEQYVATKNRLAALIEILTAEKARSRK